MEESSPAAQYKNMMPAPAADNLYKYVAIFGLVTLLFAISYPVRLMREEKIRMAETEKQSAILKVGMGGKREAVLPLEAGFRAKSDAFNSENTELARKSAALDEKTKALDRQKKISRNDNPALADALARITDEQNALLADVTARRTKVDMLYADLKSVKSTLDKAKADEAVGGIEQEAQARLLADETRHYQMAGLLFVVFGLGGIYMCIKGFALWYYRIQRYQDAILRKYVSDAGIELSKRPAKKTSP